MECGGVSRLQSGPVGLHHRGARQHHFRVHPEEHGELTQLLGGSSSVVQSASNEGWPDTVQGQ